MFSENAKYLVTDQDELVNSYCDTTEMIPVPSSSNRLKSTNFPTQTVDKDFILYDMARNFDNSTSHNKELDTLGIKDNDLFSLENNRYQVLERTPNEQSDNISDTRRHKRKKHSEDVRSLYERIGDGFKELQRSLPQTHFRKNMTKEVLLKTAASLLKNQEYRESFFLNEINRLNEELNHLNKELNHAESTAKNCLQVIQDLNKRNNQLGQICTYLNGELDEGKILNLELLLPKDLQNLPRRKLYAIGL